MGIMHFQRAGRTNNFFRVILRFVIIVKNIGRVTSNFFSRFIVQLIASEEKRGSVIPVSFGA